MDINTTAKLIRTVNYSRKNINSEKNEKLRQTD